METFIVHLIENEIEIDNIKHTKKECESLFELNALREII